MGDAGRTRRRTTARPRRSVRAEGEPPTGGQVVRGPTVRRGERFVDEAETGVRRASQGVALLLWLPFGLFFWLPFLLRRTVAYVFAVLHAGLVGGDTVAAGRRWRRAVGFYRFGFERIVRAFRPDGERRETPDAAAPEPEGGAGRFLFEFVWAGAVWTALLWLTGLWPDAPGALAAAAASLGEGAGEAGRRLVAWSEELLGR